MNQLPAVCPICGGSLTITRLYCPSCNTTFEGEFYGTRFAQLSPEQLSFIETFVRCEGKLTRMEKELNLSYPTIRNRLREIIRAMGYETEQDSATATRLSEEERQRILDNLDAGKIQPDEAARLLRGES
jgi:hypothetical protein